MEDIPQDEPLPHAGSATPNMTGLPTLPIELLLEIIDYFAEVTPMTPEAELYIYPSPPTYVERRSALASLTRTCRSLRGKVLPLLWKDVQAFASTKSIRTKSWRGSWREWRQNVNLRLICQCLMLLEVPTIAQYVETVTIALTDFSTDALPLFASTLSRLPNLKTLHIVHLAYDCYHLLNVFEAQNLSTVTTMVLPVVPLSAGALLRSCPNVEHFVCNSQLDAASHSRRLNTSFLALLRYTWPKLRTLRGFPITSADELTPLVSRCPSLEHLWVRVDDTAELAGDGQDQNARYPVVIGRLRNASRLRSVRLDFQTANADLIIASLSAVSPLLSGPLPPREPRMDVYLRSALDDGASLTRIRAALAPGSRVHLQADNPIK
ncbi:hypothetical protein HDZ31DRAFT_41389 [Schizophyllum fasciatum]